MKIITTLLAWLFVAISVPLFAENPDQYQAPASNYVKFNFNLDWRFSKGSFPFESTNDNSWEEVSTPHTYHDLVGFQGVYNDKKGAGPHTYRKHFKLPAIDADREIFLEFQAIRDRGRFILNGHDLGQHENGVTPFGFDITPYVKFGSEDNILQVEIDCSNIEAATHTKQEWLDAAFNPISGGIVRNVFLHVTDKIHATLPLYALLKTSGIYTYAENISTAKRTAEIGVDAEVKNDEAAATTVACQSVLVDNQGKAVAAFDAGSRTLTPGETTTFTVKKAVGDLHFWQPGYPYLYRVFTIISKNGKPVDVRETVTGFRKIEVRGGGLYLNNRLLMTMGYAQRSSNEWPGLGTAYPDWLHQYSDQLMVEGNATMVRWMHVMPSPQDTEACDRIGLTQMFPGADVEKDMYGREWEIRSSIMHDSMIYNRNNPSVVLWETGNNLISKAHAEEFAAYRQKWDPYGMRLLGGRGISPEFVSWMFNVRKETQRVSIDAEYMRDESPRRWWDQWSPPYMHSKGEVSKADNMGGWDWNQDNMCVAQAKEFERYYKARPGTAEEVCNGGMKIIFSDSESHSRGVDTFRRSGPVDGMRVTKDAFYCHQSLWSNTPELWTEGKPSIFLPGHWNYPAGTVKPVYVFTSPGIDKVTLAVNGKPIEPGKRSNLFYFTFENVAFQPGEIKAMGYDASGKAVATSSHVTVGEPAKLSLHVIQGPGGLRADAQDVALIQTEITDAKGNRCPNAFNLITYTVKGPANWKGGIWEEDVAKYMGQKELPVICGIHRISFRSTLTPGAITVTANSPGLPPATITVQSHPIQLIGGLSTELPNVAYPELPASPTYGPDLPPAPRPPAGTFDKHDYAPNPLNEKEKQENRAFGRLNVAFADRGKIVADAKDGAKIYSDQPWTFEHLPEYLKGAEYIQVANKDASTAAAEGFVFTLFKPATVYIAYDEVNPSLPVNNSGTVFTPTGDSLSINGHKHRIYKSSSLKGLQELYLGTNNWPDKPPAGVNNYLVFVKPAP